jgi:dTDP-4-amino-4,6-dideoxygalactose transaminase
MTDTNQLSRIYLSSPHIGKLEEKYVHEAFETNWIAPLGPHVEGFERELCAVVGAKHGAALSSGTAAIHLALMLAGVERDDDVIVSSFTFSASVNPIRYVGANPVFIDSERRSWNMDADILGEALADRAKKGRLPKVVLLVHLYGQSADVDAIKAECDRFDVPLVEDAAEALGSDYKGKAPGTFGVIGTYSFNGNKIITTAGGGMLVSDDPEIVQHARKLSTQARDPAPHYEHTEIGYNYRLSNVLAGIGRGQLVVLEDRVKARRGNFEYYKNALGDLPGLEFMPEAPYGRHTRWLICITIDPKEAGTDVEKIRLALDAKNIEARPLWKPMHMQPVFASCDSYGGSVSEDLFTHGLCIPSGSNLSTADLDRVIEVVRAEWGGKSKKRPAELAAAVSARA